MRKPSAMFPIVTPIPLDCSGTVPVFGPPISSSAARLRSYPGDHWHVLYHRMFDNSTACDGYFKWDTPACPESPKAECRWSGGHSYSADGLHWSPISRAYNTTAQLQGGGSVSFVSRERPKLVPCWGVHLQASAVPSCDTDVYLQVSTRNHGCSWFQPGSASHL